jgi:hypothetical protein
LLAIAIDVLWYYATYQLEPFWCVACGDYLVGLQISWIEDSSVVPTRQWSSVAV